MAEQSRTDRALLREVAVRLHPQDNVAIARMDLAAMALTVEETAGTYEVVVRGPIPTGHKVALRSIAPGEPVRR